MTRKINQLAIVGLFLSAAQTVAAPAARAEVTNLICNGTDWRGQPAVEYFWIDTDTKILTHGLPEANGTINYSSYPVDITPSTYEYKWNVFTATIDRNTGKLSIVDKVGNRSTTEPVCMKGAMPPPAPRL